MKLKNLYPFPLIRNYPTGCVLTAIIEKSLEWEIKSITYPDNFTIEIVFDTDQGKCKIEAWDANKYHAWFMKGTFRINGSIAYQWTGDMPSRWAAKQLKKRIAEWHPIRLPNAKDKEQK